MKTKEKKVIELVGEDEPFVSSSLVGNIDVPYKKLVKLLGTPNIGSDGHKVDAEWNIRVNGKFMSIYNYKDGKVYCGKSGIATTKLTDWHIGGAENLDAEIVVLKTLLAEIE